MNVNRERLLIAVTACALAIGGILSSDAARAQHTELPALLLVAVAAFLYVVADRTGWLTRFHERDIDQPTRSGSTEMPIVQATAGIMTFFLLAIGYILVTGGVDSPFFFVLYLPLVVTSLKFGLRASLGTAVALAVGYLSLWAHSVLTAGFIPAIAISFPLMALFGASINLRMRRTSRALARRVGELDALVDISRMLETSIDLRTTLNLVMINAAETIESSQCAVYLLDDGNDETLRLRDQVSHASHTELLPSMVVDQAFRGRREQMYDTPLVFRRSDIIHPPTTLIGPESPILFDPDAEMAVYAPLRGAEGLIGILCFSRNARMGSFTPGQVAAIGRYTMHVGLSLQQAIYRDRLERLAFNDSMTGLANYRYFEKRLTEELSRCERHGDILTVIMLDIDFFKKFNDSFGHKAGDVLLSQIGTILKGALRDSDIPARYGGEEFVIVCPGTSLEQAAQVCERIRQTVEATSFELPEDPDRDYCWARVTVSVGSATFPLDARSGDKLLLMADKALYAAKESGRNRYVASSEFDRHVELEVY